MLRLLAGGAAGLALTACVALAETDAPCSLKVLLDAAGPAPAAADTTWSELEELLVRGPSLQAALLDGATLPEGNPEAVLQQSGALSCGTSLTRAAERAVLRAPDDRRAAVSLLLQPPRLSVELALAVPGEPLIVRWDAAASSRHALLGRDTDGDRVPDAAQEIADEARVLLRRLVDLSGWDRRADGAPIEIRIAASPFPEGTLVTGAGGAPVVVIPRDARGPERMAALAHQLAHAIVRDAAPDLPASFDEAVATYLGETAFAQAAGLDVPASRLLPQQHASRTILSPGIGAARGDASFLRFVAEVLGLPPTWLGDALALVPRHAEEARRSARLSPPEIPQAAVAEALDEVLAHHGWSLAVAVAEHQAWSLEQELALRAETVSVDEELDLLPQDQHVDAEQVPPFGQLRLGVQVPVSGGLVLDAEPAEPLGLLAIASFADGTIRRFELGAGAPVTLPAASLRRVIVLVQSPQIPRRWSRWPTPLAPAGAARVVARENAAWPFAIESLGAEVQPGQVTLSWDTSSEEDLAGWIVERAIRAHGPWSPLSAVPLPAQSWPDAQASYSFIDATPRPSQRYHYRVRAVTRSGLSETTAATSVRSLPRAR